MLSSIFDVHFWYLIFYATVTDNLLGRYFDAKGYSELKKYMQYPDSWCTFCGWAIVFFYVSVGDLFADLTCYTLYLLGFIV